jgi:hypothetical protein
MSSKETFTKEQIFEKLNEFECLPLGTVPTWYKEHILFCIRKMFDSDDETDKSPQPEPTQTRVQELERAIYDVLESSRHVTGESEFDTDDLLNFAEMVKNKFESMLVV